MADGSPSHRTISESIWIDEGALRSKSSFFGLQKRVCRPLHRLRHQQIGGETVQRVPQWIYARLRRPRYGAVPVPRTHGGCYRQRGLRLGRLGTECRMQRWVQVKRSNCKSTIPTINLEVEVICLLAADPLVLGSVSRTLFGRQKEVPSVPHGQRPNTDRRNESD